MLTRAHLDQAVAKGVISSEQAVALLGLAGARAAVAPDFVGEPDEERFRIANGFNEVFIALGVILLAAGMYAALGVSSVGITTLSAPSSVWLKAVACLAGLWGLSEYLTGRRRMLAPSIVLVIAMSGLALLLSFWPFARTFKPSGIQWAMLIIPGSVLLVAGAHYLRFKFPFSLLLIAAGLIGIVAAAIGVVAPQFALENVKPIMFVLGLCVFIAAMLFDLSDPLRQTNRSDGGFWLHMIAAPLIVHPLMPRGLDGAGIVFAVFAVLALIAIVVDRRAILVASLSYLMAAIGYLATQRGLNAAQLYFVIPLVVGSGIIALGTGWSAVRRSVWSVLPNFGPVEPLRPRP